MIVKMTCPQCGATLENIDDNQTIFECPYCKFQMANLAQKMQIEQHIIVEHRNEPPVIQQVVQQVSDGNTLIIDYASVDSNVKLVTRLVQTGRKDVLISGQTKKYRLNPGKYTIVLKIGKINYNRDFIIPSSKEPVQIHCSWNKRAAISIDQPEVEIVSDLGGANVAMNNVPMNNTPMGGASVGVPQRAPVQTKLIKTEEEMTYMELVFRKATIAPWIISGILAFMGLTMFLSGPLGGILCILAAVVMNPLLTEFVATKVDVKYRLLVRIGFFILAGFLLSVGVIGGAITSPKSSQIQNISETVNTSEKK